MAKEQNQQRDVRKGHWVDLQKHARGNTIHIEPNGESGKSRFTIEIIEKSDPPSNMEGKNWYRYIISQGQRKITGFKTGTLQSVTEHVESFTDGLNERSR